MCLIAKAGTRYKDEDEDEDVAEAAVVVVETDAAEVAAVVDWVEAIEHALDKTAVL